MEYENIDKTTNIEQSPLESYRASKNAEQQALRDGDIESAKKHQNQSNKYMEMLSPEEQKFAVEYKRGILSQLGMVKEEIYQNNQEWLDNNLKGLYKEKDAQDRKTFTQTISEAQRNLDKDEVTVGRE